MKITTTFLAFVVNTVALVVLILFTDGNLGGNIGVVDALTGTEVVLVGALAKEHVAIR